MTLPAAKLNSGRKLTVTHTLGARAVVLCAFSGDGIAGRASVDMSALHDSITVHSDGNQHGNQWSSPTPREADKEAGATAGGASGWLQVAPGSFVPVWGAPVDLK